MFQPSAAPPEVPAPPVAALSYSSLASYARCGYRFYAERVLRLPALGGDGERAGGVGEPTAGWVSAPAGWANAPADSVRSTAARSCTRCSSGSTSAGRGVRPTR